MEQYAGIDVSLDSASVCIVDAQGKILKEAKVACEPEALIAWFAAHGTPMAGSVRSRAKLESEYYSLWLLAARCHTILCRSRGLARALTKPDEGAIPSSRPALG